ncbi:MAG: FAD-binding oxidoreductase [Actinomycetota bacterium]|nr:FAD-binding oxidoreductase [Actinomycetota bacterium]MDD5668099.1 FAD-binding oxidoreductase [Actinomycetota bacterium]
MAMDKDKLSAIVGSENVSEDPDLLATWRQAGPVSGGEPQLLVRPRSTAEVRELVKLARAEGINLVFSSSAPPRVRGDSVPAGEAVIVDMSGMDELVRLDRRNKVALIEPGVTFERLIPEVDKAGLKVLMPLLPKRGKSVLASALEREPITIPKYHWDMTDPMLCTELVFGTGDLFRTGSAAGPGSLEQQWAAGGAQKNPMGPAQTDFVRVVQGSQGTLAAVMWCTLKLEVKPSIHRIYFVPDARLSRLSDFTYRALRPKLGDEWLILSARQLATVTAEDPSRVDELAAQMAPWTVVYGVSGYEYLPEMRVAYQEKDLAAHAQAAGVMAASEVPGCSAKRMERILASPSPEPYYKAAPKGAFMDIFFLTTLDRVPHFVSVMEAEAGKHGYPPERVGTYIQPIQQGRNVHLEFTLYYDSADAAKAGELFTSASQALSEAGAFFSRPYGPWADLAYARCPDTVAALRKVKDMLDPDGVLNRGKLCFTREVV